MGTEPIFDITKFYNIGHWSGQGGMMIGPIARVMLPSIYLIYIIFIGLILFDFITNKTKYIILLFFLLIPILISFARSFWLSLILSIFLSLNLLILKLIIKKRIFYLSFFLMILAIIMILYFMRLDNPVSASLQERFVSIFSDLNNNSGTFEIRLVNMQRYFNIWRESNILTGVDPFFIARFAEPTLSDVGFIYVLLTIGLIGLFLIISIWISGVSYALVTLEKGLKNKKDELIIIGAILYASIIFFIVCQVYTQYDFSSSLFSIIYGTSIASQRIYNI